MAIANTTIRIKKSTVTGNTPSVLANGEIAINTADGKLFYADPAGTVRSISNQNAFGTVNVGGSLVLASTSADTLNLVAGNNVTLTANTTSKTITISAAAGSSNTSSFSNVTVGTVSSLYGGTYTTSGLTQVAVDTFSKTVYRSAKYEVQMTSSTSYHVLELRLVHDGTSLWLSQYGEMYTGSSLGSFDASISGSNVQLLFTPTNATTTVNFYRTTLNI